MIDKDCFVKKHQMLDKEKLSSLLEFSIREFPRKTDALSMHIENLNYNEIMYFANFIEDSFAFIYCDQELSKICRDLVKFADHRNDEMLFELFPVFSDYVNVFKDGLWSLKQESF